MKLSCLSLIFLFNLLSIPAQNILAGSDRAAPLRGVVLKSDGAPLAGATVELVAVNPPPGARIDDFIYPAETSISGKFSFPDVPPGKYTLSVNFGDAPREDKPYPTIFYPQNTKRNGARVFELPVTSAEDVIFKLPPALMPMDITGTALGIDGKPLENTFVNVSDLDFDGLSTYSKSRTDALGAFSIRGFKGRNYRISAVAYDVGLSASPDSSELGKSAASEPATFVLDSTMTPIKLILKGLNNPRVPFAKPDR